jgi:hypothetical protein
MIRPPIQDGLFESIPPRIKRRPATLDERFRLWIFANESVVELFLRFAREARAAGKGHFGIGAITERVRWEVFIARKTGEPFKINNSYRSRLARLLVDRDPSLDGLFEFRKLAKERKQKCTSPTNL